MNFYKLIEDIKKTNKTKTLWKSSKGILELISFTMNNDRYSIPETILEAQFTSELNLENKMKEFCKALKWLEKHKEIFEIDTNIDIHYKKFLGSDYCEPYNGNFTVCFKI